MECPKPYACSFIVKVWLEEPSKEPDQVTWRGYITHAHSGVKRYCQNLDEIKAFIVPYMQSMDTEPDAVG